MAHLPSINQIAVLGEIIAIRKSNSRYFDWNIEINVYREYGGDDVEAHLTCGISGGFYGNMIANAKIGDWASIQGKIKSNGFIQVRSMSVFTMEESPAVHIAEEIQRRERQELDNQPSVEGF